MITFGFARITSIVVSIGARPMKHTGTTDSGETLGGSSGGGELSSAGGSTKMVSDGCSYANRKVSVQRVGEHLPRTTPAWGPWRPSPPAATPPWAYKSAARLMSTAPSSGGRDPHLSLSSDEAQKNCCDYEE
jgi:hypothetical protein